MIEITVNTRRAIVGEKELITTRSAGIQVQFTFSDDWDGLAKFAIFRNGEDDESRVAMAIPSSGLVELPSENCAVDYIDEPIFAGVYGNDGLGTTIIPTIWASIGVLREGASYEGAMPADPTPDMWAQILAIANEAHDIAEDCAEAEQLRAAAEELRVAAETARAAAEDGRVSAEEARVTAENLRATAEDLRVTAENARSAAEQDRATAEAARASAETSRQQNESTRQSNETDRQTAESNRASAESTRASNEQARRQAETARADAEGARAAAETARVLAESARVAAEQARVNAENARGTAEDARASAEALRASAESARASAEAARATAESNRADTFADWTTTFNGWQSTLDGKANQSDLDALSTDVTELNRQISDVEDVLPYEIISYDFSFENKTFSQSSGTITVDNPKRLISELIDTHEGDSFTIADGFEFEIFRFDQNGNYLANPVAWTAANSFNFVSSSDAYTRFKHRIYARKISDADCTQDELQFSGSFANYPDTKEFVNIEDFVDEKIADSPTPTPSKTELSIEDVNQLDLWENGNIVTNNGTSAESTSWLFPVSIRTKTFLPNSIYYVAVDRGWFLRGFKYKTDGTFVEWITGNNITECFLSPQMKYRFQLVKEGASPSNPNTHISIEDDSYTHVHFFEIKNAPSSFYKYLDFGVMQYDSYYTGMQSAYDIDKSISYADFMTAWSNLVTGHTEYVTRTDLGAASDDQHLYLFDLNPSQINIDAHSALIAGSAEAVPVLPTIIITVCQHGNEKAAGFGAYYFIKDLLENWYGNGLLSYIRHHVRLLIIPVCNPYGWDNNLGVNANGVNINRNYPYNFVPGGGNPGDQEYAGLEALDQPESTIIYNLVCDHANALHLCDFHTTGNTAPAVNEVAWVSYFETDDLYYNKIVNAARVYLKTFSAQLIREYELNYSEDTILAMMIGGKGNGVLKNWSSSLNIIGTTLESTGEIYGESEYHTPRAMKYSSELLGNWLGVVIDAYNK